MALGVKSFKLLILSTSLLCLFLFLKLSVPIVVDFIVYEAPLMWSYVVSCFTPPYLYLLVNSIIITIVASSKLHTDSTPYPPIVNIRNSELNFPAAKSDFDFGFPTAIVPAEDGDSEFRVVDDGADEDEFVISRSSWIPPKKESTFSDKPPASARFSSRRSPKPSPEGLKRLGVSKPKQTETLETTWRTITDGRAKPLTTRHQLRKSDTFNKEMNTMMTPVKVMQKSETFGGNAGSNMDWSSSKRRREATSLSKDELNKRVEEFINKFNEEMRLQRQESLNHYKRMVRR